LVLIGHEGESVTTTEVADFVGAIEDGTVDPGAQMALWHLIKRMSGRVVIGYGEPSRGWNSGSRNTPFRAM
jgi:hypothetical protein